jgi:hypothetical protein
MVLSTLRLEHDPQLFVQLYIFSELVALESMALGTSSNKRTKKNLGQSWRVHSFGTYFGACWNTILLAVVGHEAYDRGVTTLGWSQHCYLFFLYRHVDKA